MTTASPQATWHNRKEPVAAVPSQMLSTSISAGNGSTSIAIHSGNSLSSSLPSSSTPYLESKRPQMKRKRIALESEELHPKKKARQMSSPSKLPFSDEQHLHDLAEHPPKIQLRILHKRRSEFRNFLESLKECSVEEIGGIKVILIVKTLCRLLSCDHQHLQECEMFVHRELTADNGKELLHALHNSFCQMPTEKYSERNSWFLILLRDTCHLFQLLLSRWPDFSQHLPVDALHGAANQLASQAVRYGEIQQLSQLLVEKRNSIRTEFYETSSCSQQVAETECNILPTPEELRRRTLPLTLEKNQVKGCYSSKVAYLECHYNLLREDFIHPLRCALHQLQSLEDDENCHEVKVYHNVRFNQGTTTLPAEGTVFRISFKFSGQNKVKWERSKRFTYGSLVCIFQDDFEKVVFGTVAERKTEDLKQGILTIKLQSDTDAYSFSPELSFKMIVSPAYYGAYYPVLKRLEQLKTPNLPQSELTLPFSRYLVECSSDVLPPAYMQGGNKVMDLEGIVCKYHSPAMEEELLDHPDHKVDVFDLNAWSALQTPSLDSSQKAALHAALTKELAIIQGPPGTGKTYIGLKIVEALLNNTHQLGNNGPIVVVCYTNHALDQFLEGILTINAIHNRDKKMITIQRIGGRSKSEKVQEYNIQKAVTRACHEQKIYGCSPGAICKLQSKVLAIEQLLRGEFFPYNLKVYCSILSTETLIELEQYCGCGCIPSLNELIKRKGVLAEWLSFHFEREIEEFKRNAENDESGHGAVYNYHRDMEDNRRIAREDENDDKDTFLHKALREATIKKFVMQLKRAKCPIPAPKQINLSQDVPPYKRLELFKSWLFTLNIELQKALREKQRRQRKYRRMRDILQVRILKEADVIGMTTTGAAMYSSIMSQIEARTIVIEEAAEVLEAHVITTLTQHTQHLVLIGDHEQLRPKTTEYLLARDYHLDVSLFERLVNNSFPSVTLETQHRMRPQISKVVSSCIYSGRLKDHKSTLEYEDIRGMSHNMYFVDHRKPENYDGELKSPANRHEATFLAHLCLYLLQQGYKPEEITVITPYMGQVFRLQDAFTTKGILNVRITPIDSYQGEENEIILLSLVRSNDENKAGFVKESNRVCVALSRAKCGFFCIGNFRLLTACSKLWCSIVHNLQDRCLIGTSLPLKCSSHGTITNVSSASDFDKVADGGCDKNCGARLPCNHICPRKCHPNVDEVHKQPCRKPCPKYCKTQQHRCKNLCYEECGDCKELVEKIIPKCGHTQQVPCHQDPSKFECQRACQKTLQCGHTCTKKCGQLCVKECQILVTREWPCGHTGQAECYVTKENHSLLRKCKAKCDETLECGHKCTGTCGTCYQGRLHKRCSDKCERPLLCGHLCSEKCAQNCPPCPKECIFTCVHGQCGNKCSTLCKSCPEKCEWKCEHHECTKNCGEICVRPRCNKPCRKIILKCLHRCLGLCGEQCPVDREGNRICRICDKEKWNELCQEIFGTEEEPGVRFIQLVDCGHIFEVTGLDRWMDMDPSDEGAIQWKTCLICKQPIISTPRYSNIAKQTLTHINKAKKLQCFSMTQDERKKLEKDIDRMAHEHVGVFFRNCEERVIQYKKQIRESPDSSLKQDHVILCAASDAQKACQLVIAIQSNCTQTEVNSDLKEKVALLFKQKSSFSEFLKISWHRVTNQVQSDVLAERRRLMLLANTYKLICDASATQTPIDPNDWSYLQCIRERCETVGHRINKLDDEGEYLSMQSYLQDLSKKYGVTLTKEERKMIIAALRAKPGSWYKCPKGHIYQIGDCGGATQEGKCPECGATIGGSHHRLRDDNTHAGEFDNSAHAAWSAGANLANYDLQDIH